jgi:putative FmdB family regulatory protein
MPCYDFECEPCAYYSEIFQKMDDPNVLTCPICEQETLKKVFISAPMGFVRGEPTTIGGLAEKNTKKMGTYELQDKRLKNAKENKSYLTKEQIEKRKTHQSIVSMTPEQKVNYIKTGKKPT